MQSGTAVSSAVLSHAGSSSSSGDAPQYGQRPSMFTLISRKNVVAVSSSSSPCRWSEFASSTTSMLHDVSSSGPVMEAPKTSYEAEASAGSSASKISRIARAVRAIADVALCGIRKASPSLRAG